RRRASGPSARGRGPGGCAPGRTRRSARRGAAAEWSSQPSRAPTGIVGPASDARGASAHAREAPFNMTEARKKILVPVDFEGASKRALAAAHRLAGPLEADLVLLHVHES